MESSSQGKPRRARRPWTDQDQRQAEKLRNQGLSYSAIGKAMDRAGYVICRNLNCEVNARHIERSRQWRKENPEESRAIAQRWRDANPHMRLPERRHQEYLRQRKAMTDADRAKERERHRRYYEQNKNHLYSQQRKWIKANLEKVRATRRQWRQNNLDLVRQYERRWTQKNKEKIREKTRRNHARRRAAKKSAIIPLSVESIQARFALFSNRCAYCGHINSLTVDHVLALNAGGLDESSNIVPACKSCNSKKRASPIEEWYRRQPFFTDARWQKIQRHCPAATIGQLPLAFDSTSSA